MRRWLLVGAVLLLAAAGALAYGLTRLDRYLADQRDALQAQASALLGRAVTFDALDVTLRGGVGASLTNLAIADDPRFGSGPFLTAAHAAVRLELLPALRGEYRIRRIVVDQPTVNLIRDADGWNALSIALLHRAADGAPTAAPGAPAAERVDTRLPAIGAVVVAAMTIDDGQVHIVDRTRQPPVELAVTQLRLRGHELALGAPIQFELAAAVLGASAPNLTVTGMLEPGEPPRADVHAEWQPLPLNALTPLLTAWVGPPAASLALGGTAGGTLRIAGAVDRTTLPAIDGSVTLGDVSLASAALPARIGQLSGVLRVTPQGVALENATAALGGAPLRLACQAAPPADPLVHCRLEAAEITAAQLGVDGRPGDALRALQADAELRPRDAAPVLRATARVAEGQIHGAPFRALDAELTATLDQVTVTRLAAAAFGGTVSGGGSCRGLRAAALDCSAQGSVADLRIAPLLASQRAAGAAKLDGVVTADGRGSASGRDAPALLASLRASGRVRVADGVLRHVNLAQQMVGALPGASALVSGPRVNALLGSSETRFDSLAATVQLAAQRATTTDAQIRAADFGATLQGSATLAGRLDGHGTFTLSPALAREVVGRIPILARLTNDGGMTLPYTLSGTLDDPRVRPDAGALPKALERGLSGGVEALLDTPGATEKAGKRVLRDLNNLLRR